MQLAGVHTEGNRTANGEYFVLAEEVVRSRVSDFHRAVLNAIHHAERGHQLAGLVHRTLQTCRRHLRLDGLGKTHRPNHKWCPATWGSWRQCASARCSLGMHGRSAAGSQNTGDTGFLIRERRSMVMFPCKYHIALLVHFTGPQKKPASAPQGAAAQGLPDRINKTGSANSPRLTQLQLHARSCTWSKRSSE